MPIRRYRDVSEMPPPPRPTGADLAERIRQVWSRAASLAHLDPPRGVQRFRSLEEAQEARDTHRRGRVLSRARPTGA
jgi:hypothetical protein